MKLTWNDSWILVLLDVGLLGAMPQGVRVVLLHSVVELDLRAESSDCQSRFFHFILTSRMTVGSRHAAGGQISKSVQQL